jgi:hypothetical protein
VWKKRIVKEVKKLNPFTWGSGSLCKDANFNLRWFHALDQLPHYLALLSSWPGPKHLLFPHLTHACEHLTDNNNINMLDSSSIWHSYCQEWVIRYPSTLSG